MKGLLLDLGNVFIFHDNDALWRTLAAASGRSVAETLEVLRDGFLDEINRGVFDADAMLGFLRDELGVRGTDAEIEALWSSHFTVHEAVLPIIARLVGRVKLVLVSNTNALHVRYCVAALPILQKLDALVMSNEVGFAKPDPAIFEHALGLAGVAPHEAAFFDDIQAYVDAASALGIAGRLFTTAPAFERDLTSFGL